MGNLLLIIWLHFIADFLLQSDETAQNKSEDMWVLTKHVLVYSLPFLYFGFLYAGINAILHWCVDLFSSMLTKHFHERGKRREFFITIGADQAIHMTCLIVTALFMGII